MNSMTGFGRGEARDDKYNVSVELSGVNRKQSEVAISMPRNLTVLETSVRQLVLSSISRGRVSVSISIERAEGAALNVSLDEEKATAYAALFSRLAEVAGRPLVESVSDYMRIPGMETGDNTGEIDAEGVAPLVDAALQSAMEGFLQMREKEGENLKKDMLVRLGILSGFIDEMKGHSLQVVERYRELLHKRLNEAGISVDLGDERVIKEIGIFAERCDITEEFTRLGSHFTLFRAKCSLPEPVGRPLDFLCQEIFREINTIGSKANDASLAHLVVEAKTELEKIREQIQNIE